LPSAEALDLLSALRLGVELGMVENIATATINELMRLTQPGHLQKIEGKELDPDERDVGRARMVREQVKNASIK